jgi:hypothetical protein
MKFCQTLDQTNFLENLKRNLSGIGKLMFRQAGLMFGQRRYLSGLYNLAGAFLLTPKLTFHKLSAVYDHNKRKFDRGVMNS